MPWDAVNARGKVEAREDSKTTETVRLYYEVNAAPQAVLGAVVNALSETTETAKDAHRSHHAMSNKGRAVPETWCVAGLSLGYGDQGFLF